MCGSTRSHDWIPLLCYDWPLPFLRHRDDCHDFELLGRRGQLLELGRTWDAHLREGMDCVRRRRPPDSGLVDDLLRDDLLSPVGIGSSRQSNTRANINTRANLSSSCQGTFEQLQTMSSITTDRKDGSGKTGVGEAQWIIKCATRKEKVTGRTAEDGHDTFEPLSISPLVHAAVL